MEHNLKTVIRVYQRAFAGLDTVTDIGIELTKMEEELQNLFDKTLLPTDKLVEPGKEITMTKKKYAEDFNAEINQLRTAIMGLEK